jgi:hypothetical protein
MERETIAMAGALAGFIAAVLTIIERLIGWTERAAAAKARALEQAGEETTLRPSAKSEEDEPSDRFWTIQWPAWLGPAPAYLVPSELALIFGAGILLNYLGLLLSLRLESILFFDMVGTAFAAILVGPWWGAGVALLTNSLVNWLLYPQDDPDLLIFPWSLINMTGALVWGSLARTDQFRTYLRTGHASVLSHLQFLLTFGVLGACVMSVPGTIVQSVVDQTSGIALNAMLLSTLQEGVSLWRDALSYQFDSLVESAAAQRWSEGLLSWLQTCLLYIPDKVVSAAVALILVKRGFPMFEQELVLGRDEAGPPTDNRVAPLVLALFYAPSFAILVSSETYLGRDYWPLWSAPWVVILAGYLYARAKGPADESLRAARAARAARYRAELSPIHEQPTFHFCQRLLFSLLIASAIFVLFMPLILADYSTVAFNFFCVIYGAILCLTLIRVSIAQNLALLHGARADSRDEAAGVVARRGKRRVSAA